MKVGQFATTAESAIGLRIHRCIKEWSVCDNDSKSAIGLRVFIGALKNGRSTMAAFNAVAGLNPFTIIAVA